MDKIRWGIIAPGNIAHNFASDLQLVGGAEIVAVASRSIQRATEFAKQYSIKNAYGSYEELVKDANVDVVYIASPHTSHFEHSMLCLKNKKHVLCEKPIGVNSEQLSEMVDCATKNKLFLMEAFWTRFIPSYLKLKELISNGEIGDIRFIQADFSFIAPNDPNNRLYNKKLGGGSLLDIGIYPVFMTLDILGKPKDILSSAIIGETGVDESCNIMLNYPEQKASANLYSSITTTSPIEALVCGTKGEIKLESTWIHSHKLSIKKPGCKVQSLNFKLNGIGYSYEIEEANNCIRNGKLQSDVFPLAQSLVLHQTLDTIRSQIGLKY